MNREDEFRFQVLVEEISTDGKTQEMKKYIQHGKISTYEHCMQVARLSYELNRKLHFHANERELVRGAFLHDYYLYDWHLPHNRLHGFYHPGVAVENASRDFKLSSREKNIIASHMWPLTVTKLPKSREAVLVGMADKLCSTKETLFKRR